MNPHDGQAELVGDMAAMLALPTLDGEGLARLLLVLERLIDSGLVSREAADRWLAPVREGR
jgi:hypothetical protein